MNSESARFLGMHMKKINNTDIIKYFYDFITQSSLSSFTLSKESSDDCSYFKMQYLEKDKKVYKDNIIALLERIDKLASEDLEKFKIFYFPFANEFTEASKNRNDNIYSSPIYFIFNIDKKYKRVLVELKNISITHQERYMKDLFKDAQIIFNNYYASNKLYIINISELETFKLELKDKEFDRKYPKKDFTYYLSVLKIYIESSNISATESNSFSEIITEFNKNVSLKINENKYLNCNIENGSYSILGIVNTEKLVEQDVMVRGLLNSYKSSIMPYIENADKNDKLNRILYSHPSEYFEDIGIKESKYNTLDLTKEKLKELQKNHLGSFSSKFAITLSQRLSLSSYLSPMDIIPVNGPPGTGKTALLRAIFADYIVKIALNAKSSYDNVKKDPYSFVDTGKPILGTSSVRQAINNIIEGISGGFKEAQESNNLLYTRWLRIKDFEADKSVNLIKENCVVPQIRNSENKYENGVLFTSVKQIFDYMATIDTQLAQSEYLKNISTVNNDIEIASLDEAIEMLYTRINNLIKSIENKIINATHEEIIAIYEQLDKTDRFDLFFYSVHLLEAFFILNLQKQNKKSSNGNCPICDGTVKSNGHTFECSSCEFVIYKEDKFKNISIATKDDLKNLIDNKLEQNEKVYGIKYSEGSYKIVEQDDSGSNLSTNINNIFLVTPLFPMITVTMHSLFGAFKHKVNNEFILIKDFFDLVLSDESGMILAPVGLPALYMAKKMVIVGDEKQIEPVYPFDEIVDRSIISNIVDDIDYSNFKKYNSAIFSNFLTIANRATKFNSFEMKSHENNQLWLKEHFRCKDEIIEYCNEIIYNGILIPKVRHFNKNLYLDEAKAKYPSIKLFNIDSIVTGNKSPAEADAVVDFLSHNIPELTKLYNSKEKKDLQNDEFHKHIGIVTPFNNQKKLLQNALKKANKYNLDKILVGTVHAFQGSEREIIIFSPAIDKNYNGTHFTNNDQGNMMNVAVSRAKSAFWVFGSKEGMLNSGEYTKVLVEYIEKQNECEIKCPLCNNFIIEEEKTFKCETNKWNNTTKSVEGCTFVLWKQNKLTNSLLEKKDVIVLLSENALKIDKNEYRLDIKSKFFISKISLETDEEKKCPECQSLLVKKKGKFGDFFGCSDFPKCKYTCKQ